MHRTSHAGFTLIELMLAVALGIILMTMAVPSFTSIVLNNRLATKTNELIADLHFARTEAIKQGRTATVCRSTNGTSCAGSGQDWATGWLVWVDSDGNGTMASTEIVRVHEAVGAVTLTGSTFQMQYAASGFNNAASTVTFTLNATGCTGNQARTVTIIPSGRSSVATSACA